MDYYLIIASCIVPVHCTPAQPFYKREQRAPKFSRARPRERWCVRIAKIAEVRDQWGE